MKKYVDADTFNSLMSTKKDIAITVTDVGSTLTLSDNTEYRLTDISSLTLSYPQGNFEIWMNISFSPTEAINVVFPPETKYIGTKPTFDNGQTWEVSIKDGAAICWRIE